MAYNFNGTDQRLAASNVFTNLQPPFTYACWFNATNLNANQSPFSIGTANATSRYEIFVLTTGALNIAAPGGTGLGGGAPAPSSIAAGTSNHVAGVYSQTNSRQCFLNGAGGTVSTTSTTLSGVTEVHVGTRFNIVFGSFFAGSVAEVGVWDVVLTAAEIESLAKGVTCDKVRPQSLRFYAPLIRDLQDLRGGLTITNTNGATVADHPRVYK